MKALTLVACLLEDGRYDIDDPLEKPEYPLGFIAHLGTDIREWRYDGRTSYALTVGWIDDYSGKLRSGKNLGYIRVDIENAGAWVKEEMQKWQAGGWEVEEL